ncbi:DEAD/DEAH box helicase family protein, partial [bacterium]|nr:DEAD/DEAH box helicase family protein [bacterium]
MKKINEAEAEILFEEHLRERGWDIADFTVTRKRFRDHLDGEEADRVFLHEGKVVAILEAKKPGRDLWAALEQAKAYARAYKRNTGHDVPLLFASDGEKYLRQNLKANTLPESIPQLPTPAEFNELFRTQSDFLLGDLRDYQRVAVSQVLAAVQAGRKQMYIQMATGTGKTITAAGIIAKLWSLGLVQRALFLVDRDALAAQTERAFRDQLGDSLTVRRATGDRDDRFADVLVTTVQHLAVHSKYETFPSDHFGLVFLGLVRTVARHKKHDFYLARKGDVIFNNTNSPELVGKTILFLEEDDFYFSNHLSRIRTTDGVTNEWLAGLLHVLWTKGVFRGMCRQWVNQASVSKESVFALEVPIPSPTALLNHREALEHLSTRRDGFAKAHDEAESLFSILLSHALTGELTAEWEAANADWIAERQVFYGRLPRLGLLSLLLERRQRAGSGA